MKTGRKARINICSAGRLYLPLLTLFSVPPTLLWLFRLVTLTSTRGWASLRQHHFSMNTQTHTRPHVVIVCPSLRRECTRVWVFPQLDKKACCANKTIAVELLPDRRTSVGSVPRATVALPEACGQMWKESIKYQLETLSSAAVNLLHVVSKL